MTMFIENCNQLKVFHKRSKFSLSVDSQLNKLPLSELHLELSQKVKYSGSELWNQTLQSVILCGLDVPSSLESFYKCKHLTLLSLIMSPFVMDSHLLVLFPNLPQLKVIELDGCYKITEKVTNCIAQSCYSLSQLSLNLCPHALTLASASTVAKYLPELMWLRLFFVNINSDIIALLRRQLPYCKLEYFSSFQQDYDFDIKKVISKYDLEGVIKRYLMNLKRSDGGLKNSLSSSDDSK
eukprot:TRINITY_DN15588_c0_g1_i1.p1 TRINITY_DN15588_c0_g1~~TRINITY_DN15588_c0_g1_i1.p1  ORF type:complete len:238 (-),score=45.80 TRINITY_DN15588_c0_g1_i1:13-726(-)